MNLSEEQINKLKKREDAMKFIVELMAETGDKKSVLLKTKMDTEEIIRKLLDKCICTNIPDDKNLDKTISLMNEIKNMVEKFIEEERIIL